MNVQSVWLRCALLTLAFALPSRTLAEPFWLPVRGGITMGISGMALLKQEDQKLELLVVHDNKKSNQPRLGIVSFRDRQAPDYQTVDWATDTALPEDLESLTAVPGSSTFMAMTSKGQITHFELQPDRKSIRVLKTFNLPTLPPDVNLEGLVLQQSIERPNGQYIIVWAHRGESLEKPALIYWGLLNLSNYQIQIQGSMPFSVPYPINKVRPISDLNLDESGTLYVASAEDNGDDGPFASAIYVAGTIRFDPQKQSLSFVKNSRPAVLQRYLFHKVEALELIPGAQGGIIVGTDDERMGSAIAGEFDLSLK
ncbi:hypothetical protein K9N68_07670 [Kovacikia minuta CCNUW1]|uniref:hypothetical protein n=1 Tax=Kovacikia minuta TaxID=2931930 RepID=UPI001CCA5A98|nr:hypothetical protein [Kovacikia minuta]UBF27782.1 hypothetical protein K9N68_07670 [Kovacikia minuta CCNUW1]